MCWCRHGVGMGSVDDPGLGGRRRTRRFLAHKHHEHSLAGAPELLQRDFLKSVSCRALEGHQAAHLIPAQKRCQE